MGTGYPLVHHSDFRVIVRDFGPGEREVIAQRLDTWVNLAPRRGGYGVVSADERIRKDQNNRERAARQAVSIVRQRVKVMGADRMVTLTYRENMCDRDRLLRDWKAFVMRLRRSGHPFEYVATYERQKRGAFHMHVAVKGRQNYRLLRAIWLSVVGVGNGNVDVRNPLKERGLRHKLAGYLSKYIGKAFLEGAKGERRVWGSRGLDVPQAEVFWLRGVDWQEVGRFVSCRLLREGTELVQWYSGKLEVWFCAETSRL